MEAALGKVFQQLLIAGHTKKKPFETGSATEVRPDTFTVYSTNAVSMQYVQSCTFLLLKLSFQRKTLALPKSENILIKLIDSSPVTHP